MLPLKGSSPVFLFLKANLLYKTVKLLFRIFQFPGLYQVFAGTLVWVKRQQSSLEAKYHARITRFPSDNLSTDQ